ncbi:MAG: helix-turn-helix transcriptional regulator [Tissierellales bacterium]|nr:helix-turn-helix transcriptional regulator [Tissierellales bacterium]MBN2826972.1 helix-turn-helix transcriptional regulator [Tissierellales bacterium]
MKDKLLANAYNIINDADDKTKESFELDDILYDISIKIFDYRNSRKLSQKDFAEILGISQSMVSKLESGLYNPTIEQLWKLSKKLNIKFGVLLEDNYTEDASMPEWCSRIVSGSQIENK